MRENWASAPPLGFVFRQNLSREGRLWPYLQSYHCALVIWCVVLLVYHYITRGLLSERWSFDGKKHLVWFSWQTWPGKRFCQCTIDPLLRHVPLSYCCYVCQAFKASIELTLPLTAHPGEILPKFWKSKQTISARSSQKVCNMNLNECQTDSEAKTG